MADVKKYLDLTGLGVYDGKIKAYIVDKADVAEADAISASAVTISTETTTDGYAKSYTFSQNGATIATIDIPKDMVVSSGQVVEDPEGQPEGTYLELTLANATNDKVYINVGTLVDLYIAKADATQVQVAIDSATREISATIVAGGVGSTELAEGAVVTAKIGDAQVTKAKLDAGVQASLDSADSAVQEVITGTTNGTVKVDDTEVAVAGLKSAAYVETTAFDAAGTAETKVNELANGQVETNRNTLSILTGNVDTNGSVENIAKSYADVAQTAAEAKVTALETGAVATNTADISALTERVDGVVSSAPTTITTAEIEALFSEEA